MSFPSIHGRCPACGWTTLFYGDDGYITCSRLECPDPSAASDLLDTPDEWKRQAHAERSERRIAEEESRCARRAESEQRARAEKAEDTLERFRLALTDLEGKRKSVKGVTNDTATGYSIGLTEAINTFKRAFEKPEES